MPARVSRLMWILPILGALALASGCAANKSVVLIANKAEGLETEVAGADFHSLGLGAPRAISASHGEGIPDLTQNLMCYKVVISTGTPAAQFPSTIFTIDQFGPDSYGVYGPRELCVPSEFRLP